MDTLNQPTINSNTDAALPSLGKAGTAPKCNQMHCEMHQTGNYAPKENTREAVENLLDEMKGANLVATVRQLNGTKRGAYRVTIKQDAEYNEVQCRLYEDTIREPIATGFIDRGHTIESRYEAAAELRCLVRAYLCR